MYSFVSSIAKPLVGNKRWTAVDVSEIPISTIFSLYSKVLVTLSNPFLTNNVSFNLEEVRSTYGTSPLTFNEFLIEKGNGSLFTSDALPSINTKYVKYADAFAAKYKIRPIENDHLELTREFTDYELFHKSCLVNVNGFFHYSDRTDNGIRVVDAMRSVRQSRQNQMGICSFREVGELTLLPILPSMVYKQNPNQLFKNAAFVDTGVDLSNKTVMLVLGGYLHLLDKNTFFQVSDSAFGINFNNISLLDRYYESTKYINFDSLTIEENINNRINIASFYSDDNIKAYLTLSQSFFVAVNNSDIFTNKISAHKTKLPDLYTSYAEPKYPLIVGNGKLCNYWTTYEDGIYTLSGIDTLCQNRLYDTVDPAKLVSVSNARLPNRPTTINNPYFLEIGTDI